MNKKKSIFLNQLRAVRRKVKDYLYKHRIISTMNGLRQNKMFILFLNELGEEVPKNMSIRDFTILLYNEKKYNFLQAVMNRPDIPPSVWRELKKRVYETYGKICLCCNSTENISVDHIKPYSRFPELCIEFENLQPLCRSCNSSKGNRIIVDYR